MEASRDGSVVLAFFNTSTGNSTAIRSLRNIYVCDLGQVSKHYGTLVSLCDTGENRADPAVGKATRANICKWLVSADRTLLCCPTA